MTAAISVDDVFINCPFYDEFQPIFRAITFTVFACGFRLRTALELDDGLYPRLDKILNMIGECALGIHDLSRTELDSINNLPRFNMPFEFGIFVGAKRFGSEIQEKKRALVLDIEQYRYQKFISDINGMDIREHGADPKRAIVAVRNWLVSVSRRRIVAGPLLVGAYDSFSAELPANAASAGFDPTSIPYVDFEFMVTDWLLSADITT